MVCFLNFAIFLVWSYFFKSRFYPTMNNDKILKWEVATMLVFRELRKWMLERLYMYPSHFVATITKASKHQRRC